MTRSDNLPYLTKAHNLQYNGLYPPSTLNQYDFHFAADYGPFITTVVSFPAISSTAYHYQSGESYGFSA